MGVDRGRARWFGGTVGPFTGGDAPRRDRGCEHGDEAEHRDLAQHGVIGVLAFDCGHKHTRRLRHGLDTRCETCGSAAASLRRAVELWWIAGVVSEGLPTQEHLHARKGSESAGRAAGAYACRGGGGGGGDVRVEEHGTMACLALEMCVVWTRIRSMLLPHSAEQVVMEPTKIGL